jgi:hypothetical protein
VRRDTVRAVHAVPERRHGLLWRYQPGRLRAAFEPATATAAITAAAAAAASTAAAIAAPAVRDSRDVRASRLSPRKMLLCPAA